MKKCQHPEGRKVGVCITLRSLTIEAIDIKRGEESISSFINGTLQDYLGILV